jgi:Arc/MetJ-type ribon-helix-helix transcriptional regulator
MKMITLFLPEPTIEELDRLVGDGFFPNRSELLRFAIFTFLHDLKRKENEKK